MLSDLVCPACEASEVATEYSVEDHEYALDYRATYAQCENCGSLFQTPMPTVNQLAGFYPPNYHSFTGRGLINYLHNSARFFHLKPFLGREEACFLDYGCGSGQFLHYLAAHTRAPLFGYEIANLDSVEEIANRNLKLVRGSHASLIAKLTPCQLLSMHHVIEHLPDPAQVIGSLYEKMVSGSYFIGQTPVANSFEHQLFGNAWSGFHAPRHTVIFSRQGLVELLRRVGFVDIKIAAAFNPAAAAVSLASKFHNPGTKIQRHGLRWLALVGLGSVLSVADLFSGNGGIMNFSTRKP